MSYSEVRNLPVRYRKWFIDRLVKHYSEKNKIYKDSQGSQNQRKVEGSDMSSFNKYQEMMNKKFT